MRKYRQEADPRYLKAYYNHPSYAVTHSRPKAKWQKRAEILLQLMELSPGEKVLDVGCAGKLLQPLVERIGGHYVSLDIAAHFEPDILGDATVLSLRSRGEFDWIIMSNVLEHIPNPGAALRAAMHAGRRLLIGVPHLYRLEAFGGLLPRSPVDRHLHRMSTGRWENLVRECGGVVEDAYGFHFIPSFCFDIDRMYLSRLDEYLRRSPSWRAIDSWMQRFAMTRPWLRWLAQEVVIRCRADH